MLALSGPTGAARADELIPFKVAISTPVVSILPVFLAADGGFYKKQSLDVDIISTEGGTKGMQVLLSGEIQAMHVGLSPVVAANAQGAEVRAIASTTNTLPISLFSAKKLTPPLPKGTTIGISTLGSETDIALTIALKALGLARSDMQINQIGGTSQRFAAMSAGRIEAAPLLEPGTTAARQKGFTEVYDLSAAKTPWIFDAVVVTTDYAKDHADAIQRFLKAYVEGAYWGMANPDKAKEVISRRFKTKDPAVIDSTYNEFKRLMPRDARPSVEGSANVIKQLASTGLKLRSEKVEDYVDLGPIDALEKSGFIAEMQRQYAVQ
ncbi:ABC transporter substrate-binding protein [Ancylobacter polymorphus]|uniref:NitT/TauT family transport system substrate-binding protein n=1 Tax=Ancylobacter polymorphus TaxID=223390 RepID=A0ABU0BGI7_9HYPH|nr:ABC transporter substrate-binding protein [Ancylobacter polymorphus]MDQ0304955.1 NitT/TauT family transport system substrate-binding protein [Ancylobacter polymorphus]